MEAVAKQAVHNRVTLRHVVSTDAAIIQDQVPLRRKKMTFQDMRGEREIQAGRQRTSSELAETSLEKSWRSLLNNFCSVAQKLLRFDIARAVSYILSASVSLNRAIDILMIALEL